MPPFASIGIAAFFGSVLACCIGVMPSLFLVVLMIFAAGIIWWKKEIPHRTLMLMFLTGGILSMGRCVYEIQTSLLPLKALEGETLAMTGQITDILHEDGTVRYTVQAAFPETDLNAPIRIDLWAKGDLAVGEIGDTVSGNVALYEDETETLLEQAISASYGTRLRGFLREGSFSESRFLRMESIFSLLRRKISKTIAYTVPGQAGALTSALLCGDRTLLDASLERDILVSGLTHLLSISGSHLSIMVLVLRRLVKKLNLPVRTAVCFFGIVFYALLTGASYAVLRAAIMCALLLISEVLGRSYDGINALGTAVFVIVLAAPFSAVSLSLWYSCAATLSILLTVGKAMRYLTEKLHLETEKDDPLSKRAFSKGVLYLLTSLCASAAASLAVLPISWAAGNTISLLSPISTLVAGLFLPLIVFGGFLICVTAWIPPLSAVFAFGTKLVSGLLIWIVRLLADFPFAVLPKNAVWIGPWLLGTAVILLLCLLYRRRRFWISGTLLTLITCALSYLGCSILMEDLTRVVVPAETGCAVISQGSTHLLVGTLDSEYEAEQVADTLRSYGIHELQLALLGDWDAASMETIRREAELKLLCTDYVIGSGLERYADTVLPLGEMTLSAGENLSANVLSLPMETGFAVSLQMDRAGMLIFCPEYAIMNISAYPFHNVVLLPEKPVEEINGLPAQYGIVTVHTDEYNLNHAPASLMIADASKQDAVFFIRDGGIRFMNS